MGALRLGMMLFGVGLFLASVAAVGLGLTVGCADVGCVNHQAAYSLAGVGASGIAVSDGCNTCTLNPVVVGGTLLSLLGVVVGGVGVVRDEMRAE